MQVIYKSVLAFKNCQAVFRSHSSGALPVLAITGFMFVKDRQSYHSELQICNKQMGMPRKYDARHKDIG